VGYTRIGFNVRVWNHQWLFGCIESCSRGFWGRFERESILRTASLQKNIFLPGKEDITVSRIFGLIGARVLILPHLGWSRVYLLLGIHHTLVWSRVLQHSRRWLQIMLWGLLGGKQC
jgi:hypothetical protein